jgi:hypothetical protein
LILTALNQHGPMGFADLQDFCEARRTVLVDTLVWLTTRKRITREGRGKANDPFVFSLREPRTRTTHRGGVERASFRRPLTLDDIGAKLDKLLQAIQAVLAVRHEQPAYVHQQYPQGYYAPPPPQQQYAPGPPAPPPPSLVSPPQQYAPRPPPQPQQQGPVLACMFCGQAATARLSNGAVVCPAHAGWQAQEAAEEAYTRRMIPTNRR